MYLYLQEEEGKGERECTSYTCTYSYYVRTCIIVCLILCAITASDGRPEGVWREREESERGGKSRRRVVEGRMEQAS